MGMVGHFAEQNELIPCTRNDTRLNLLVCWLLLISKGIPVPLQVDCSHQVENVSC
jgi:hypothetical protein